MSVSQHIDREQLVLYALQFLDPTENAEAREHLSDCRECRRELDRITGDLAVVALTAEMHSPPALARQRIAKQAARERRTVVPEPLGEASAGNYGSVLEPETRRNGRGRSVTGMVLGWLAAVAFAATSLYLYQQHSVLQQQVNDVKTRLQQANADADRAKMVYELLTDHTVMRSTLTKSVAGSWPTGRVSYLPETGSLLFIGMNLDPLPPHQTYELWLLPNDGREPIACGTFTPDTHGNANVVLPELQHDVNARTFAVSLEDQGGASTPTMPYVLTGN